MRVYIYFKSLIKYYPRFDHRKLFQIYDPSKCNMMYLLLKTLLYHACKNQIFFFLTMHELISIDILIFRYNYTY